MKGLVMGLLVALILEGWATFLYGQPSRVPWRTYQQAMEEAKRQGKHVLLYFYEDFCAYCKKMDRETFSDPSVMSSIEEGFVAARIRVKDQPLLARRYFVRAFPTVWFLTPKGEAVVLLPGYVGPKTFLKILDYVEGRYYKRESLQSFLGGS